MIIERSPLFKARRRHLSSSECDALKTEIDNLTQNPKLGLDKANIAPGVRTHAYTDQGGRKVLSYKIVSEENIVLLSIDQISISL